MYSGIMDPASPITEFEESKDILANLHGAYAGWVMQFPQGEVVPGPEVVLIDTGMPIAELNVAFIERGENLQQSIQKAARFFGTRSRPWRLETPFALAEAADPIARSVGLHEKRLRPTMLVLSNKLERASNPPEIRIKAVENPDDLEVFRRTLIEGMSGTRPQGGPGLSRFPWPGFQLYVGFVSGEPVATAAMYRHEQVAGIYAVATVERARRRGYGRAVTERAIVDAFDAGCSLSILQSSDMGRSVYESMGYRWIYDRPTWSSED